MQTLKIRINSRFFDIRSSSLPVSIGIMKIVCSITNIERIIVEHIYESREGLNFH